MACYLLAIGAAVQPWRLNALIEQESLLDAHTPAGREGLVAAFPAEDAVRLITRRGCSCELVESVRLPPRKADWPNASVYLSEEPRRLIARGLVELGSVRLYLRTRRQRETAHLPRQIVTIEELLSSNRGVPADVLVDVVPLVSPQRMN